MAKRRMIAIALGAVTCAVIVASAAFDYSRAGHFPHLARDQLGPIARLLHFEQSPARTLTAVPLSAVPLFETGADRAKAGDVVAGRAMVREALRRDPQLFEARLWLANDAVRAARYADAVRQFDWLYAIGDQARPAIISMIVALARIPTAQPAIEAFAKRKPVWLQSVADGILQQGGNSALVFRLLGGATTRDGSEVVGKSGLVNALASHQQYDAAYLAWVSSLPQSALSEVGYVYDAHFRQLPGALPFNWALLDSDMASVDFLKQGGVQISYFGDGATHLLEQTMMLPKGRFKFVALAANASGRDANRAAWTITCVGPGGAALGTLDIPSAAKPVARAIVFQVPDQCPAQKLSLDGAPSEFPAVADIQINAVSILRSDGGR